ncbi:nuclear transport factor 2 family protein [Solimonas sp. SE-A11]|uniref:nuclear transport factor 2 family protein n=1 Tax=Solimonas sp. SE-A11 TaxID=3054954 RepID=UPI00259CC2DE|nr:nuclear transport factor 2 family protein [Solimonas sp. SE-A11]MDM4772881.1 nuclear transport factor 2 family protein [Solimonas sp. SE-A11]
MDVSLKGRALDFLRMVTAGEIRAAYRRHVAPDFRHHNAWFAGDADSLMRGMEENHERFPRKLAQVRHALQDGDTVAVHTHLRLEPEDRGMALVHIFRFEDGLIAELWDLAQAVPEQMPNENGMF